MKIKKYNGGYTVVKRSGSYGLFNSEGKVILDQIYDEMDVLNEHFTFISVNDRVGYFDLNSGWIWEPIK